MYEDLLYDLTLKVKHLQQELDIAGRLIGRLARETKRLGGDGLEREINDFENQVFINRQEFEKLQRSSDL